MKPKGTRVWVAVDDKGVPIPHTTSKVRAASRDKADGVGHWYTVAGIRRATLVLDPVPKRKRKGAA